MILGLDDNGMIFVRASSKEVDGLGKFLKSIEKGEKLENISFYIVACAASWNI